MKKRILCLLLALVLLLSAGCSSKNIDENDFFDDTDEDIIGTGNTENDSTEDEEEKKEEDQENEEVKDQTELESDEESDPSTPPETSKDEEKPSADSDKPAGTDPATKPEGEAEDKVEEDTEKKEETPAEKPYFLNIELSNVQRVYDTKVGDQYLSDVLFGKDQMYFIGDTLTFRVNMSDGGTAGFEVIDKSTSKGLDVKQNGNLITVKTGGVAGNSGRFGFTIRVDAKGGRQQEISQWVNLRHLNMEILLKEYAEKCGLIWHSPSGDEEGRHLYKECAETMDKTDPYWLSNAITLIEDSAKTYKYYYLIDHSSSNTFEFASGSEILTEEQLRNKESEE